MADEIKLLKESYEKYLELNYVKSRLDPEEEPYKTKYEAREVIQGLIAKLDPNFKTSDGLDESSFITSDESKYLIDVYIHFYSTLDLICSSKYSMSSKSFMILKLLEFNLARNFIETEEIEHGEKMIAKVVRDLENLNNIANDVEVFSEQTTIKNLNLVYNPLIFNLKLSCINELVFVWSSRANYKKCVELLKVVEEIYEIYRNESVKNHLQAAFTNSSQIFSTMPFDPSELICLKKELTNEQRQTNFEALYTHSLFYFAQVYGKLDEKEKSAYYCELTLQRQIDEHSSAVESLTSIDGDGNDLTGINTKTYEQPQERVSFNPLDWATHAAAISQFYVCSNDFATARHCLCCSEAILNKLHENVKLNKACSVDPVKLKEQTQSIRRCWGKYAIELLKVSRNMLRISADEDDQKTLLNEIDRASKFRFNLPKNFYKLDECEKNAITSNIALDYDQARVIFLKAQTILNEVKDYFVLDGYVTDHCEIIRDLSDLYAALIFFEEDLDRRCKLNKRRLDMLIPVCDEISSQFYLTIKRQLLFDIGTIYSEQMDSKVELFKIKKEDNQLNATETASAIKKINLLANNSMKYFEMFLDTMKVQPKREVLPEKFDDHNIRPALLAKFYIGRLYSKIITTDSAKRLANLKQTFDCYSYIVNYCDKESQAGQDLALEIMRVEYDICKEMISMLPAQMDKFRTVF